MLALIISQLKNFIWVRLFIDFHLWDLDFLCSLYIGHKTVVEILCPSKRIKLKNISSILVSNHIFLGIFKKFHRCAYMDVATNEIIFNILSEIWYWTASVCTQYAAFHKVYAFRVAFLKVFVWTSYPSMQHKHYRNLLSCFFLIFV